MAHYIPWRAIRAADQLSDSKGVSAALSAEVAAVAVHRSMRSAMGGAGSGVRGAGGGGADEARLVQGLVAVSIMT